MFKKILHFFLNSEEQKKRIKNPQVKKAMTLKKKKACTRNRPLQNLKSLSDVIYPDYDDTKISSDLLTS